MTAHASQVGGRYRLIVLALFGVALALAGGASRYDEDQQTLIRLAAVAAIAAALWPLDFSPLRRWGRLIVGVGAVWLLVALQLAPLPPDLWARLPGHDVYAKIATETGSFGWRPLSLTPDLTLNALYALVPATAAGLCALYLDFKNRLRVAEGVVLAAVFSGALGLAQLALGGDALRLYRETSLDSAVGLFANRNHQAAFLACALPLVGAIAAIRPRAGSAAGVVLLASGAGAFLLLALVATQSRMGLLLGAIGLIGAVAAYRASGRAVLPSSGRMRAALAGGVAALGAALVLAATAGGVLARFSSVDPTTETRLAAFKPMLATAKAFMPLGAGFGAFDSVYRRFEPDALLSTVYMNQAHNEPLQLAIEGGIPALLLLVVFLGWWGATAVRAVAAPPARRAMGLAAVAVTAILMASSLVDYPLRTPLLSALFAIACVQMAGAARAGAAS